MVLRAEGEFVGVAADRGEDGASDDGAGDFAVEIVSGLTPGSRLHLNLPVCSKRKSGGPSKLRMNKTAALQKSQRRAVRSKSTQTSGPSGGTTWMVAESELKAVAGKSRWREAPIKLQYAP